MWPTDPGSLQRYQQELARAEPEPCTGGRPDVTRRGLPPR
jgi:hypothetical protein